MRGTGPGDRNERTGRDVLVAAEMLRDSFGLADRAAYMVVDFSFRQGVQVECQVYNRIDDRF